jgi:hypothetical protein
VSHWHLGKRYLIFKEYIFASASSTCGLGNSTLLLKTIRKQYKIFFFWKLEITKKEICLTKIWKELGTVDHACNSSYLGSRRIESLRTVWATWLSCRVLT